jgi:hypothetical protein
MPFSAELRIPVDGTSLIQLKQCEGLKAPIRIATEWEGRLRINVLQLLLVEDVYGDRNVHDERDRKLWSSADGVKLLIEAELQDPQMIGYLGKWNLPFLRWLKSISLTTQEELSVLYDHERGDNPYEDAWWTSTPWLDQETLGLSSYEGTDNLQWQREVTCASNGAVEVAEQGSNDGAPLYL